MHYQWLITRTLWVRWGWLWGSLGSQCNNWVHLMTLFYFGYFWVSWVLLFSRFRWIIRNIHKQDYINDLNSNKSFSTHFSLNLLDQFNWKVTWVWHRNGRWWKTASVYNYLSVWIRIFSNLCNQNRRQREMRSCTDGRLQLSCCICPVDQVGPVLDLLAR